MTTGYYVWATDRQSISEQITRTAIDLAKAEEALQHEQPGSVTYNKLLERIDRARQRLAELETE